MAELFQRAHSVITKHIKNVFEDGEFREKAMCKICTLQFLVNRWPAEERKFGNSEFSGVGVIYLISYLQLIRHNHFLLLIFRRKVVRCEACEMLYTPSC